MTVNQETPKASDSPAIQAASMQQRRAEEIQARRQPVADQGADDPAGALAAVRPAASAGW